MLKVPKILAPAGDKNSFLAAIAAGADAIYCGLKIFSARMEADNFSIEELARLTDLAHSYNVEVCLALNSIIKESELNKVYKILCKISKYVKIDALIIQDPVVATLARKAGFEKELHLSTLGNCTFSRGLKTAKELGFNKVVLPREFNIDQIKQVAKTIPHGMELEIFVHGALCYCISGRCYWSSWFGGKSSLRGRCVQPCRRLYEQKGHKKRHFSCMDFSADVLAKVLKDIQGVTTWKIEGRKKSPHYVYYTVSAYKLLRDEPKRKKEAMALLDYAMGREFSHYNLLTQRQISPLDHSSETGSGLFAGRVKNPAEPYFITRETLFPSDLIRIGFEGDSFHDIQRVTRAVPKKGKFFLNKKSKFKIKKGTPAYIIDRRGPELMDKIIPLSKELDTIKKVTVRPMDNDLFQTPAVRSKKQGRPRQLTLSRGKGRINHGRSLTGTWISSQRYSTPPSSKNWLWLDPLLFPEEETACARYISNALKKGAKTFVINALWQLSLFKNPRKLNIWAGPYCNLTNSWTINEYKKLGCSGAIVSPELDKDTFLELPQNSNLPLGIVLYGNWPLGISRIISPELKTGLAFKSPKGETSWVSKFNNNYFIFPNWLLDIRDKQRELEQVGYSLFIDIHETVPKSVSMKKRPGLWNWNLKLV